MYYSDDIIDQVRSQNDIVDVIGGYVGLTKKGTTYFGLCPFHGEKTPSFSVNPRDQFFYCFGCHKGGNVITFVQQMENMTFTEALSSLADRAHITLPVQEMTAEERHKAEKKQRYIDAATEAARYYRNNLLQGPNGAQARGYLRSRQVTDKFIVGFGLGYSPVNRDGLFQYLRSKGYTKEDMEGAQLLSTQTTEPYDRFYNRLMFPIFDISGHVIAFGGRVLGQGEPKYLNSPDSALFNKRQNLYMIHVAKKSKRGFVILAEGYMDVLSLHQAGFDNAVASLGTALTENQARLLKRFFTTAYLCYDSDKAGTNAAMRAIPILRDAGLGVKVIRVSGAKDPDELIKTKGPEAFEECIQNAYEEQDFMRMALTQEFSGGTIEDKVKILNGMKESLANIVNDTERELRVKDQAVKLGVSAESLLQEVNALRMQSDFLTRSRVDSLDYSQYQIDVKTSSDQMLVSTLLQRPDLFEPIAGYLSLQDFSESSSVYPIISKLWAILTKGDAIEDAIKHLTNSFTEPDEMSLIASLLTKELPTENEDLSQFLTQLVKSQLKQSLDLTSQKAMEPENQTAEFIQEQINKKKELEKLCITI